MSDYIEYDSLDYEIEIEEIKPIMDRLAPVRTWDPFEDIVKTKHVFCPDCGTETFGPYHDPVWNTYFTGHYCEDCGITWNWDDKTSSFRSSW